MSVLGKARKFIAAADEKSFAYEASTVLGKTHCGHKPVLSIFSLFLLLFVLGGCAGTAMHPELPAGGQRVHVSIDDAAPGMNDNPVGSYVIPGSQVVVTKPRPISTLEGGFGAAGVLVAHSSGKKAGREMVAEYEGSLGLGLKDIVRAAVCRRSRLVG